MAEKGKKVNKKVIAVDIGGTNLRVSVVKNNKILTYVKKDTPRNKKDFLKELYSTIDELMSKDVKAIGVGSPGPLKDGIIKNPPNIPLRNFNVKKELEKRYKRKVVLENDAHCVAIAEARLGCRKRNFIVLTFGTGIGGGIVINGKLYTGQGYAGELGHILIHGEKYFEDMWKESRKYIKENFGENILMKDLVKMNTREASLILDEISSYVGQGIGSVINIFDPEIIVLNGGMKEAGNVLLDKIKKEAKRYSILPHQTPMIWSKLNHPGTLGASLLVS